MGYSIGGSDVKLSFADFCALEYPRLVGALDLYTGDRALAEDLAQEALEKAFRRWDDVVCLESPGGWTYRVAINLSRSHFRRENRGRRLRPQLIRREDTIAPDPSIDFGNRLPVHRALQDLPEREREAIVLRYYLDMTVAETAWAMKASPDAVRGLTKRAFVRLRTDLNGIDRDRQD